MKKLLIANYACSEEDCELTTNSWTIGMYENEADLISAVNEEFNMYIYDEVADVFDLDTASEEELQAAEDYKNEFDVAIYETRDDRLMEATLVGELTLNSNFYVKELKIFVITLEK